MPTLETPRTPSGTTPTGRSPRHRYTVSSYGVRWGTYSCPDIARRNAAALELSGARNIEIGYIAPSAAEPQ